MVAAARSAVAPNDKRVSARREPKPMELRHLRYFLAVAEELNFTRAAERLGINQPPLSLQIRQLEKEIGTPLFRRKARGVELTNAGKLMLEEARVILRHVEQAKTGVRRRGRGETGRINIGSSGGTYFHPLVPTIIREYRTHYPEVVISPAASSTPLLVARLQAGKIDVAILRPPLSDSAGLALEQLVDEPFVIVVPGGHPLSERTSAPLNALAEEPLVLFPRELNPGNYDSIIAACIRSGFRPKLGQEAPQVVSIMPMVAAGLGFSIVPQSLARICRDGVAHLSIEGDAPRALISLAHRRDDRSPAVQNLVAVARRVVRAANRPRRRSIDG
jgi:DNA-binding transcriptional LysR family regulator